MAYYNPYPLHTPIPINIEVIASRDKVNSYYQSASGKKYWLDSGPTKLLRVPTNPAEISFQLRCSPRLVIAHTGKPTAGSPTYLPTSPEETVDLPPTYAPLAGFGPKRLLAPGQPAVKVDKSLVKPHPEFDSPGHIQQFQAKVQFESTFELDQPPTWKKGRIQWNVSLSLEFKMM